MFSISCYSQSKISIWDNASNSADKSLKFPLVKEDGEDILILNNIVITSAASTRNNAGGNSYANASAKYSLITNDGTVIEKAYRTTTGSKTYNLFGMTGLSDSTEVILHGIGSVSTSNGGVSMDDVGQEALASMSYQLQYVKVALKEDSN